MKCVFRAFLLFTVTTFLAVAVSGAADMKIEANREKSLGDSSTIIVPTVYLKLPVAGKVFSAKQSSGLSILGGGSGNSVKASAHYTVDGLSKEYAQALSAKVYADFVAQLRQAGYTVKTYEDIKDSEGMKKAQREKPDAKLGMPLEKEVSGNTVFAVVAPSDDQAFKSGMGGAVLAPFMKFGKSNLGDGTILIPTYVIAAPQAWAETGSGYKTISASVNVAPGMNLTFAMAQLLTSKGGWGDVRTKEQVINIGENVGELAMQDTTSKTGNALSGALSVLTGSGKISGKSGDYQLKIDAAAYEKGVLNGTGAFNAEVAKVAAKVRK